MNPDFLRAGYLYVLSIKPYLHFSFHPAINGLGPDIEQGQYMLYLCGSPGSSVY
jgi:hypothetical protein